MKLAIYPSRENGYVVAPMLPDNVVGKGASLGGGHYAAMPMRRSGPALPVWRWRSYVQGLCVRHKRPFFCGLSVCRSGGFCGLFLRSGGFWRFWRFWRGLRSAWSRRGAWIAGA